MSVFKVGIMGTGGIANVMARTVAQMENVEVLAVASRSSENAASFAQKYSIKHVATSYEALAADERIDLIYVCSPHPWHFGNAKTALEHGRNVLCEKPFTMNLKEAKALFALAEEKNLFITEAMWTRFLPMAKKLKEVAFSGAIGKPVSTLASFGKNMLDRPRLTDPRLGGGALLDLCIYPFHVAYMLFGPNASLGGNDAALLNTGVDALNNVFLRFGADKTALLSSSLLCCMPDIWFICGDAGMIEVTGIHNFRSFRVIDANGQEKEKYLAPPQLTGYEYQLMGCMDAVRNGKKECPEVPRADTLSITGIFDLLLSQWGIKYPGSGGE
jgi:predicted dehydrogenase